MCPSHPAQRDKIARWSARKVANVIGAQKPPWMEMDQWWRSAWSVASVQFPRQLKPQRASCIELTLDSEGLRVVGAQARPDEALASSVGS